MPLTKVKTKVIGAKNQVSGVVNQVNGVTNQINRVRNIHKIETTLKNCKSNQLLESQQ